MQLTFFNNQWQSYSDFFYFSGETGTNSFNLPFNPDYIIVDYENLMADAVTDNAAIVKNTGIKFFTDAFFKYNVQSVPDSAFLYVAHNWVAPDSSGLPQNNMLISNNRYWIVRGNFPTGFVTKGSFSFNKYSFDQFIGNNSLDSLKILYRPHAGINWTIIPSIKEGFGTSGYLIIDTLKLGEYALGVAEGPNGLELKESIKESEYFKVFPNPSATQFKITIENAKPEELKHSYFKIINSNGRCIHLIEAEPTNSQNLWNPQNISSGTYYIQLISNNQVLQTEKIIYNK